MVSTTMQDGGGERTIAISPMNYGGHCYYVRKCITGEQVGPRKMDRAIGGIFLPENYADRSQWVEVLAAGRNVGKRCAKWHAKKFGRARQLAGDTRVGDMLLCPNEGLGIMPSPFGEEEFFIEESVPMAVYREGQDNE